MPPTLYTMSDGTFFGSSRASGSPFNSTQAITFGQYNKDTVGTNETRSDHEGVKQNFATNSASAAEQTHKQMQPTQEVTKEEEWHEREAVLTMLKQNACFRDDCKRKLYNLFNDWARAAKTLKARNQHLRENLTNVVRALDQKRAEHERLERDFDALRQKVASMNSLPNQVADDVLKSCMSDLFHLAGSWVRSNFRKYKSDEVFLPEAISPSTEFLLRHNQGIFEDHSTIRLQSAQAVVGWALLSILQSFYYGIDKDGSAGNLVELARMKRGMIVIFRLPTMTLTILRYIWVS
jgi:hypothetical protein